MTTRKSKYWRDRIKKEMDAKEADDISLEQSMKQLHDYHFRNIEKEIESFYQRYADKEKIDLSEARKRASELDISAYQKKAKELVAKAEKLRKEGRTVTRDDFTHQENADMSIYNLAMKTNALELLRLNIDLEMQELANGEHKLTKKFLDEGYRKETEFQAGLLGLSVASQASVKSLADAVINANFKGAKWSDNIWDRQDKLRSIISQSVQSAILKGKNGLTIARDIRREFDMSASYAKRLAITEHARVQMEVGRLSMAENGFTMFDIIPEPKACDICKDIAKHGPYHLDKWRTGENSPPFHPYCRCAIVGVDESGVATDRQLDYNRNMNNIDLMAKTQSFIINKDVRVSAKKVVGTRYDFWAQDNTKKIRDTIQSVGEHLDNLEGYSIPKIVFVKKAKLQGWAGYDYKQDTLFISDLLNSKAAVSDMLLDNYFAAVDLNGILVHELTHKKHWDTAKQFYKHNKKRYNTLEEAKNALDSPLVSYIKEQKQSDYNYLYKISEYADVASLQGKYNEVIAEAMTAGDKLSDPLLLEKIKEVFRWK
ncbi:phage head morphogenesis, SPP1 gp7 family domain protein [Streptococcus pyogenes]|uniref:phage minor head protein n=1 Tax=Streptococcus pyogenes TaxID=1314 RepID=UPI0010A1462D|nr:phage minor head protein [Streptococcus pyogenes]VHE83925.1 phage head morphogenesis, SPP1 gp7 family domain protein [Streptococcus pyogenes]